MVRITLLLCLLLRAVAIGVYAGEENGPLTDVKLGEVGTPTGTMMIIDPGLGESWRHDLDPRVPGAEEAAVDLEITGPDALAAGKSFDRAFHPLYIYDVSKPQEMQDLFARHCTAKKLKAHIQPLPHQVPHIQRARRAAQYGGGLGVVEFDGRWGVVVSGLPAGRNLPVIGRLFTGGEFEGRLRSIDVVVDAGPSVARSESVTGVMVEYGELMCVGLEPLGSFRAGESTDGRADVVFWGRDAPDLAKSLTAESFPDKTFGYKNLPLVEARKRAATVRERAKAKKLKMGMDFRLHDNLERLNAQVRTSPLRAGQLDLAGSATCGFANRWGDGIFTVTCDRDTKGNIVRVRMDVGNAATQTRLRQVFERSRE